LASAKYILKFKIKMRIIDIENLVVYVTKLSEDFVDDYLTNPELQKRFINQVLHYANDLCGTEQELLAFVDGLLINLYD